ncbi:MAG: hypothetical protein OEW72_01845 [Gammaproteobacteria bacterium]|nr:hypothetical protein [Gammaproteobacteria bacterium]
MLLDAVDLLERAGISYVVVGAMAAAVHGVVRASMDADAVIRLPAHRAAELERECRAAGFISELRHGDPDDPIGAVLSLSDEHDNRVDLLLGLRGLGADVYARATLIPFQDRQLRVVGREDFIAMKLFAHGPQDLIDAEHALVGSGDVPDLELLRKLATGYGPETLAALEGMLARSTGIGNSKNP